MNPNRLPRISLMNIASIDPPYVHRKRKAEEYILYVIKSGVMYLREHETDYELLPGDVILLDPAYYHEGRKSSHCEYYYIHFWHEQMKSEVGEKEEEKWRRMCSKALQSNSFSYESYDYETLFLPKYFHYENQVSFIQLLYLLNEAKEENQMYLKGYKIRCSCKVLEAFLFMERSFLSANIEQSSSKNAKIYKKVEEILNLIQTSYQQMFCSKLLEEKFSCNFDYMNRVFKQTTGSTIFSYLNHVRIDHAKELLLTTSLSVTEIGERVGFQDIYYFSKVFKKHTGVSPTKFL